MTPDLKKRQGVGIRIYLTGQFEENYWIDDQAEGIGRCIFKLGSYYEGGFKHNVKHGYGDYVNYTGDRYIGYYKNDEREYEGWKLIEEREFLTGIFSNGFISDQY